MTNPKPVLFDQPTKKPTSKVVAATAGSGSGVGLGWLIGQAIGFDSTDVVCQIGDAVLTWADVCYLAAGLIGSFSGGYAKRERNGLE